MKLNAWPAPLQQSRSEQKAARAGGGRPWVATRYMVSRAGGERNEAFANLNPIAQNTPNPGVLYILDCLLDCLEVWTKLVEGIWVAVERD